MTAEPRKLWSETLELAVYGRLMAERWTVVCREQAPTGTFYLGQRVRVTVGDILCLPSQFHATAGMLGVIAHMPSEWDPDYGVILDSDPAGRRRAYGEDELASA